MRKLELILAELAVIGIFIAADIAAQTAVPDAVTSLPPTPNSVSVSASDKPESPQTAETIRVLLGETVEELELEEYVYGVLAAEMPASFHEEALKAQAVAARTYALYQSLAQKHETADVCGDSTCCQAYITQEELDARWENDAAFYTEKLRRAVSATDGEILTYDGAPAATVYHASSVGSTRSAAEVWGNQIPYLVAVETYSEKGEKGHGVGMSQYGANDLAASGKTYTEILAHYYSGTVLSNIHSG